MLNVSLRAMETSDQQTKSRSVEKHGCAQRNLELLEELRFG
jgi:hypothetical protein